MKHGQSREWTDVVLAVRFDNSQARIQATLVRALHHIVENLHGASATPLPLPATAKEGAHMSVTQQSNRGKQKLAPHNNENV